MRPICASRPLPAQRLSASASVWGPPHSQLEAQTELRPGPRSAVHRQQDPPWLWTGRRRPSSWRRARCPFRTSRMSRCCRRPGPSCAWSAAGGMPPMPPPRRRPAPCALCVLHYAPWLPAALLRPQVDGQEAELAGLDRHLHPLCHLCAAAWPAAAATTVCRAPPPAAAACLLPPPGALPHRRPSPTLAPTRCRDPHLQLARVAAARRRGAPRRPRPHQRWPPPPPSPAALALRRRRRAPTPLCPRRRGCRWRRWWCLRA